jgi:hypothetical protein
MAVRYTRYMAGVGKFIVVIGVVIVAIGLAVMVLDRMGLPLGRLPGDIFYRGKHTTFYFPLATSILLSVVLSVVMYLIGKLHK